MAEFQNSRACHQVAPRVRLDWLSCDHAVAVESIMRAMRVDDSGDEVVPDSEEERLK